MEKIEEKEELDAFYLPHHGVLRETSTTTKLRVVFNGSQKADVGVSLNDVLHAGPKLQQDLVNVLLRWRRYPFVFSSDSEKMYRQISVHPDDRKYQRILWSADPSQKISTFELSTVTYGLTSALFLATRVLHQLASDHGDQFPLAAAAIRENFYVDDVLSGDYSIKRAQAKAKQVDNLLMAGGFPLQKWATNHQDVLAPIEISRRQNLEKTFEDGPVLRALGLKWDPTSDCFVFTFHREVVTSSVTTKRSVLSLIARMFDPLGWLAPIVVSAKIFLQQLWTANLDWDDELPPRLALRWEDFTRQLFSSQRIPIPRWIGTQHDSIIEIHGFSDASQSAMAAAVYIRVQDDSFHARSSLLIAKTKVALLKAMTIPRLELSAAVLLSRHVISVQDCLGLAAAPLHLWVDSSVALAWISAHPSRWRDFISNRVSLIQELVPSASWHHIPGTENPSDVASRGLN